jgi:hypothetical protein
VPSSPTALPPGNIPVPIPTVASASAGIKRKTCGLKAPHGTGAERISARPPSRGIPSSPARENEPILERAPWGEGEAQRTVSRGVYAAASAAE